jgi:hypothetical protein
MLSFIIIVSIFIITSFIDFKHQIIPDIFSLPGIILGLFFQFFIYGIDGLYSGVIAVLVGGGIPWLVSRAAAPRWSEEDRTAHVVAANEQRNNESSCRRWRDVIIFSHVRH